MKKILLVIFLFVFAYSCNLDKKDATRTNRNITTYYLIRHAEKDRNNPTNKDPKLTAKGLERAKNWAKIFDSIDFTQIYTTNYKRTLQTAAPTAESKNIKLQIYNPSNLYNQDFKNNTKGQTVLIVGHSNTTPAFVNAIIKEDKYPHIKDTNNSNLYIVSIINDSISVKLETHN